MTPQPAPNCAGSAGLAPGVYRRKQELFVQRGANLSHACLICASPPAGEPVVLHLPASRFMGKATGSSAGGTIMLVLTVIEWVLTMLWSVVDFPKRRRRMVTVGYCAAHRRKFYLLYWGGIYARLAGGTLILVRCIAPHLPAQFGDGLLIAGLVLFFTGVFLPWDAPVLELARETQEGMWVTGAKEPFLKLYPSEPSVSTVPKK